MVGFGGGLFAVPLNAFLQERADGSERGRIMATNNFANMLGVILASGTLWLLHDKAGFSAATILLLLGLTMLFGSILLLHRMMEDTLRFCLFLLASAMFRVRIEGRENIPASGPALLASNHISYADPVLVGCTARERPIRFLMWKPIHDLPVANYFFRQLRTIPVAGNSPTTTLTRSRRSAPGSAAR